MAGLLGAIAPSGCESKLEVNGQRTGNEVPVAYILENTEGDRSTFIGWDNDADLRTVDEGFLIKGEYKINGRRSRPHLIAAIDAGQIDAEHIVSPDFNERTRYRTQETRPMTVAEQRILNTAYHGHNIFD